MFITQIHLRAVLLPFTIAALFFVGLFLYTPQTRAFSSCNAFQSIHKVPLGFGAAYDVFRSNKEIILNANCEVGNFRINIGHAAMTASNFAVYKTGYRWTNSAWQKITLVPDGGSDSGNYILGKAKLGSTAVEYASGDHTFFVVFTCSLQAGEWKCGCSDSTCATHEWQLQAAVKPTGNTVGSVTDIELKSSPANKIKGLRLIYNFDSYWNELINNGDANPSVYHNNAGHNDTRNKCVSAGCTRSMARFDGRATMKFTTYAGDNYSASAPDGGQVSQTNTFFTRHSGKSYGELMHSVDMYIPSSANFHILDSLLNTQTNSDRDWDRCKIGGKGPIGIIAGQVNPLPPAGGLEDGWQYVFLDNKKATAAITGPATIEFGNRECSGFYNQFKMTKFGFWPPDIQYMTGVSCQKGSMPIIPRDRWVTLEMYGKLDTNGSNGIGEVYVDGELGCGNYNLNWGGNKGWRFVGFGGIYMWGGAGDHMVPRDTTSIYYSNSRVFGS